MGEEMLRDGVYHDKKHRYSRMVCRLGAFPNCTFPLLFAPLATRTRRLLRNLKFVLLFNTRKAEGTVNGRPPHACPVT